MEWDKRTDLLGKGREVFGSAFTLLIIVANRDAPVILRERHETMFVYVRATSYVCFVGHACMYVCMCKQYKLQR